MFVILDIPGEEIDNACLMADENGHVYQFEAKYEAEEYAKEECAWDYIIIEY